MVLAKLADSREHTLHLHTGIPLPKSACKENKPAACSLHLSCCMHRDNLRKMRVRRRRIYFCSNFHASNCLIIRSKISTITTFDKNAILNVPVARAEKKYRWLGGGIPEFKLPTPLERHHLQPIHNAPRFETCHLDGPLRSP